MKIPDYRSVYTEPDTHVAFLRAKGDANFEGQHFERKEVPSAKSNNVLSHNEVRALQEHVEKTLSAFANADGGMLVLGIAQDGTVTGLNQLNERQIDELLKLSSLTGAVIQAKLHRISEGEGTANLALFRADAPERSICQRIRDEAAWIRKGSSTHKLRGAELDQLRRDRRIVDFEMTQTEEFEEDDVDQSVYQEFVNSLQVNEDDRSAVQVLRDAGALAGQSGARRWTNAGLLFFAYNPRRVLAQAYIRLLRFECLYDDEDERPTPSFEKDFDGPITKQIRDFRVFVRESGFFKTYHVRDAEGGFVSEAEYPSIIVDEAIVNAVAHRDHGVRQPVTCEKYEDAFVVKSPGSLLQPFALPDSFRLNEHMLESIPRNRKIMDWLRLMKDAAGAPYVKAVREGTRRMRDEMEALGLPSPEYLVKNVETVVVLRNDVARREPKRTGLAEDDNIHSDEFTNLFRLTGFEPQGKYPNQRETRGSLLEALTNKLEANGYVVDLLSKGRAIVHTKGAREPLPEALNAILRIIPAYAIHVRSYFSRHYLVVDYKAQVQSLWTAQRVMAEFGASTLTGMRAFGVVNGRLNRGRISSATSENVKIVMFDSNEEEVFTPKNVFPSLRRDQIDRIVQAAAPGFNLARAIKKASLATGTGSSRLRAELIQDFIDTVGRLVFPVSFLNTEVQLSDTPLRLLEDGDGKRAWLIQGLKEPDVEFGHHRATSNIRDGITTFGSFEDRPKDVDIVAIVQPGFEQKVRELVSRLQSGAHKYRGSERTFSTRLRLAQVSTAEGIKVDEECGRLIGEYPDWIDNERLDRILLVHTPEEGYALDDVSSPYFLAK